MQLTSIERMALRGLQARDRELYREYVKPLQEDNQELMHSVAERLGLAPDALMTTHRLDAETGLITALRPAGAPANAEPPVEPTVDRDAETGLMTDTPQELTDAA